MAERQDAQGASWDWSRLITRANKMTKKNPNVIFAQRNKRRSHRPLHQANSPTTNPRCYEKNATSKIEQPILLPPSSSKIHGIARAEGWGKEMGHTGKHRSSSRQSFAQRRAGGVLCLISRKPNGINGEMVNAKRANRPSTRTWLKAKEKREQQRAI